MDLHVFLIFLVSSFAYAQECNKVLNDYHKLKDELLCKSSPNERPVNDTKNPMFVQINCYLLDYDFVANFHLISHVWLAITWNNTFMSWKPSEYSNVSLMLFPPSKIWTPSISIPDNMYNTKLPLFHMPIVQSNGLTIAFIERSFYIQCKTDAYNWPYDSMTCDLTITLDYPPDQVLFRLKGKASLDEKHPLLNNKKFELIKAQALPVNGSRDTSSVYFTFVIKRRGEIYTNTLITPVTIAISLLLLSFWIDPMDSYRIIILSLSLWIHIYCLQFLGQVFKSNAVRDIFIAIFLQNSAILCGLTMVLVCVIRAVSQSAAAPVWLVHFSSWVKKYKISDAMLIFEESRIYISEDESFSKSKDDWILTFAIIDRFLFLLYLTIYLITFFEFSNNYWK